MALAGWQEKLTELLISPLQLLSKFFLSFQTKASQKVWDMTKQSVEAFTANILTPKHNLQWDLISLRRLLTYRAKNIEMHFC